MVGCFVGWCGWVVGRLVRAHGGTHCTTDEPMSWEECHGVHTKLAELGGGHQCPVSPALKLRVAARRAR